jgi:hypothetical protein
MLTRIYLFYDQWSKSGAVHVVLLFNSHTSYTYSEHVWSKAYEKCFTYGYLMLKIC